MVYAASIASSVDELAASLLILYKILYKARKGSRRMNIYIGLAEKGCCIMDNERLGYYAVIRLLRRPRFQPHWIAILVLSRSIEYNATMCNWKMPVFHFHMNVFSTATTEVIILECQTPNGH